MTPRRAGMRSRPVGLSASSRFAILLAAPAVIVVLVMAVVPLAYGIWLSLTNWSLVRTATPTFHGLDAYVKLVADGSFWISLGRTAIWTIGTVVIELAIGLPLALLLNIRTRVTGLLTGLQLLPWVIPYVVTVFAWRFLLDSQRGPLHAVLHAAGLVGDRSALSDPAQAFVAVTAIGGWAGAPFMTIALLAALKAVPLDLYEAASVDGAGPWARFANITVPFIRQTAAIMSLVLGIFAFYSFDIVWLTTKGGPVGATEIIGVKLYDTYVNQAQPGYAAAIGVVALLILAGVGALVVGWTRRSAQ
jgi:ABC-type sugar transport system permease subunit